jgi:hypothetical protein
MKKYLAISILLLAFVSTGCPTGGDPICEGVNYLADLAIDDFIISTTTATVNEPVGTTLDIINKLLQKACAIDTQDDAGKFFSDYQAFYRESANGSWQLVGSSNQFAIDKLAVDEKFTKDTDVSLTQEGEYYLVARVDIGDDIVEEVETNNEKNGDENVIVGRAASGTTCIITVVADENTDFELMRRNKEQGIYAIFNL